MKKLFLTLAILLIATTVHSANIVKMIKGDIVTAHDAVTGTATSSVINTEHRSLLLVEVDLSATGTPNWTIHVQGSLTEDGTFVNWYEGTTALSTGALTADGGHTFKGIPSFIKIVATENSGTGTATVRVQSFN